MNFLYIQQESSEEVGTPRLPWFHVRVVAKNHACYITDPLDTIPGYGLAEVQVYPRSWT